MYFIVQQKCYASSELGMAVSCMPCVRRNIQIPESILKLLETFFKNSSMMCGARETRLSHSPFANAIYSTLHTVNCDLWISRSVDRDIQIPERLAQCWGSIQ